MDADGGSELKLHLVHLAMRHLFAGAERGDIGTIVDLRGHFAGLPRRRFETADVYAGGHAHLLRDAEGESKRFARLTHRLVARDEGGPRRLDGRTGRPGPRPPS